MIDWNAGRYYVTTRQDLARVTKSIKNLSVTDDKAWNQTLWRLIGARTQSGEQVDENTALTYSAVWAAVQLISSTISTLPLHLLKKNQRKTSKVLDNPLYRVLHDRFNSSMTAQIGREVMTAHILTWGNCYAEIVRDPLGRVYELWPIGPDRVTPEMTDNGVIYRIRVGSETKTLSREKILHIPGLGYDGLVGYSVIAMARKSIGLGMAMETFGERYFGAGTHPGVIVSHPGQLKDPTKLRDSLAASYSGLGQSHRLMLLEEGMKLENIGIPPNDSQFIESRGFQIPEIARWFNLPPHKLKDLTRSSFSNIESEQISFVTDSILPWLVRFEQHYNMQLLAQSDIQRQSYTKHNVDGLMRGDSAARAAYYGAMWGHGFMTINEIREKEDWDPSDQPYADELFIPANNMIPVSKIDEFLARGQAGKTEVVGNENMV